MTDMRETQDTCPFRAPGDIDGQGRPRDPVCDGLDCPCTPGPSVEVPAAAVRTRHHADLVCAKCGQRLSVEAVALRGGFVVTGGLPACRTCGAALSFVSFPE